MTTTRGPRGRLPGGRGFSRSGEGPPCPIDPEHGPLRYWGDKSTKFDWMCPHVDHAGRIHTHPQGYADPTPCFFTDEKLKEYSNGS